MLEIWRTLANISHVATILGCAVASYILFASIVGMGSNGGPDFSSVIGLSFVVIPYCAGRTFEALAARPVDEDKYDNSPCPACKSSVPKAATRCKYCQSTLIPLV